jgi:hypothetical protein
MQEFTVTSLSVRAILPPAVMSGGDNSGRVASVGRETLLQ